MAKRTVSVGDATRYNHHNDITTYGDADHDWDESTGTGYHNATYNAPTHFVNVDSGNESAGSMFLDANGDLRVKVATATSTPPTPSSISDGNRILVDDGTVELDSGTALNWNSGDVVLTHSANALALTGGKLGVGVTPTYLVDIEDASDTTLNLTGNSTSNQTLRIRMHKDAGNITTSEHIAALETYVDVGGSPALAGQILFQNNANGNSNDTSIFFEAGDGTTVTTRFAIQAEKVFTNGNVNLGVGTATFGTSAQKVLAIANGTAPSSSPADCVQLYAEDVSASSELKVRDEAGNITVLSPHNFSLIGEASEEMAWAYYSERNGKIVNVDMMRLARLVEKMSGEKLVFLKGAA